MRKLLLSAVALLATAGAASAADYVVYQNGTVGTGLNVNPWWNVKLNATAANPSGDGVVFEMSRDNSDEGNFCAGIQAPEGSSITGPLNTATLTFSYYATTTCDVAIRIDSKTTQDYKFSVTEADLNKWNEVSLPLATHFATVAEEWKSDVNDGLGDVFGVVVEKFTPETKFYFNNVIYKNIDESWVKPEHEKPFCPTPAVPTRAASAVMSLLSGAYEPVTTFNIGSWGQSTKSKMLTAENDAPVEMLTNFNYIGWEFAQHIDVSKCDYLHVEYYTTDGTKLSLTPISPGKELGVAMEAVKQNEWNIYDLPLSKWVDAGVVMTDLFQMKYEGDASGYLANVYFYDSNAVVPDPQPEVTVPENLYIVGNIKGNDWVPAKADKMNKEGNQFTIEVELAGTDSKSYFSFIPEQGEWAEINGGNRYGAVNQDLFGLNEPQTLVVYNQETEIKADQTPAFAVSYAGPAVITVDFDKMNVTVTEAAGIDAVENADNTEAVYYNLQGVRVACPANGIFIRKVGDTVTKVMVK